ASPCGGGRLRTALFPPSAAPAPAFHPSAGEGLRPTSLLLRSALPTPAPTALAAPGTSGAPAVGTVLRCALGPNGATVQNTRFSAVPRGRSGPRPWRRELEVVFLAHAVGAPLLRSPVLLAPPSSE